MKIADIPTLKFPIPFANAAGPGYIRPIPEASQIGIQDGAASLTDGFPPLSMTPEGAGGTWPFGQDFNGLLLQITQWVQWLNNAGGPVGYDGTFSSAIGGYPQGAVLAAATSGWFWISTVDDNTSDPDTGGANWVGYTPTDLYAADSGTANAMVATLTPAPPSFAALTGWSIKIKKGAADNTSSVTLNLNGFGAKPVVHPDGSNVLPGELPSSGMATVVPDGTSYQLQNGGGGGGSSGRTILSGDTTFYIATTGNDANDGLTALTPWLTFQHAWNVINDTYDLAGFNATVTVADGTYTAGFSAYGRPPGADNVNSILFMSTSGNANSCIINDSGTAFGAGYGAAYTLQNFKVTSGGNSVDANAGGQINHTGMVFGSAANAHMFAWNGGRIYCEGNYAITGSAEWHLNATRGGEIYFDTSVTAVTVSGSPAFSSEFALCAAAAQIYCDTGVVTFSGSATGKKYIVEANGVIDTNGGGGSFPGSIAGTTQTGGQYV